MISSSVTVPGSCLDAFRTVRAASNVSRGVVVVPMGCGSPPSESVSVISLLLLSSLLFSLLLQASSLFLGALGTNLLVPDVLDGVARSLLELLFEFPGYSSSSIRVGILLLFLENFVLGEIEGYRQFPFLTSSLETCDC